VSIEAKAACAELVDDPIYREKLKARLMKGKLAPALESMLWHYAKGKPKEQIVISADKTLAQLIAEALGIGDQRIPKENDTSSPSGADE
jgi:hypothetical protein